MWPTNWWHCRIRSLLKIVYKRMMIVWMRTKRLSCTPINHRRRWATGILMLNWYVCLHSMLFLFQPTLIECVQDAFECGIQMMDKYYDKVTYNFDDSDDEAGGVSHKRCVIWFFPTVDRFSNYLCILCNGAVFYICRRVPTKTVHYHIWLDQKNGRKTATSV